MGVDAPGQWDFVGTTHCTLEFCLADTSLRNSKSHA